MRRVLLIALGALVFVAISVELARFFQTESHERADVLNVLEAQVKGNPDAVFAPARAVVPHERSLPRHRRRERSQARAPGRPEDLALQSSTAYALGAKTGITRVAWTIVDHGLPVVQCVSSAGPGMPWWGDALVC